MTRVPGSKGKPDELVRRYLRAGQTAVDVGAAIGELSTVMAQCVGPTGHVIAIEPDVLKIGALTKVREDHPQIDLRLVAAGERAGYITLFRVGTTQASRWHGGGTIASVEMQTLDTIVGDRPVDLVKMDVQGSEAHILDGATRLLDRCPVWIVELWPWGLHSAGRLTLDVIRHFRAHHLVPQWANGAVIDDAALEEFDTHEAVPGHTEMRNIVIKPWWNICAVAEAQPA